MKPAPILAVNLHSYSQLWMYPYAFDFNTYPENVEEIVRVFLYSNFFRLKTYRLANQDLGVHNKQAEIFHCQP